jgi:hypothetical protein
MNQIDALRNIEMALDNLVDIVDASDLSTSLASYGAIRATHGAAIVALGIVQREIADRQSFAAANGQVS